MAADQQGIRRGIGVGGSRGHLRRRASFRAGACVLAVVVITPFLSSCGGPLPLGPGRNFLGTNTVAGFGTQENFWLAIGGYCQRREYGDIVTAYADNTGGVGGAAWGSVNDTPDHSCQPAEEGGPSYVRKNSAYNPNGYTYAIEFPAGVTGTHDIQIYDPGTCDTSGSPAGNNVINKQLTRFTFRNNDSTDPLTATPLTSATFGDPNYPGANGVVATHASCTNGNAGWWTLHNLNPTTGTYFVQVQALAPAVLTSSETQNFFALRVSGPGGFVPCTTTAELPVAGGIADPSCPAVRAVGPLGWYLFHPGGTQSYPVLNVPVAWAGRTLHVELFDLFDSAGSSVELLDPNGSASSVAAEVACQDGRYRSEVGITDCGTGELPPTTVGDSAYGPWTASAVGICGPIIGCGAYGSSGSAGPSYNAQQPWGYEHLIHRGLYNDRTIRLSVTVRSDYAEAYAGKQLWSLRVTTPGGGSADRSTIRAWIS